MLKQDSHYSIIDKVAFVLAGKHNVDKISVYPFKDKISIFWRK